MKKTFNAQRATTVLLTSSLIAGLGLGVRMWTETPESQTTTVSQAASAPTISSSADDETSSVNGDTFDENDLAATDEQQQAQMSPSFTPAPRYRVRGTTRGS